jgi:hypothetical protein
LTYVVNEFAAKPWTASKCAPWTASTRARTTSLEKGRLQTHKAYAERTALRWPKIPLVSASLKCEVRTADTSSMPKSFAVATCPWLSLQGNDRDDSQQHRKRWTSAAKRASLPSLPARSRRSTGSLPRRPSRLCGASVVTARNAVANRAEIPNETHRHSAYTFVRADRCGARGSVQNVVLFFRRMAGRQLHPFFIICVQEIIALRAYC